MSGGSDFADRVADYLHEISAGETSITDEMIDHEPDPNQAAMMMGLVMLHEQLSFQSEQRREAEDALTLREARFRALFDLAKVSIWDCDFSQVIGGLREMRVSELDALSDSAVIDLIGTIEVNAVNRETLRLLGASKRDEIDLKHVFGAKSLSMMRLLWRAIGRGEHFVELEGWVHRLVGDPVQVMLGVTVPEDNLAIVTLADISAHAARVEAERRAEERAAELADVNEEVERLFYAVSHDMRAPLRAVQNLAGWMQEDMEAGNEEEVLEHLHMMENRIGRLDRMMNDLLSYARIGRTMSDVEKVNVGELLDEIRGMADLPDGFRLSWGDMPTLRTHRTLLSQVFLNLIGNAVKHHDKSEGRITIAAESTNMLVTFRVIDDGPGIPEKYRAKVFGLFSTLKPRDVVEGSGMGLAFVQKVINKVGGAITIEGDDDRGTTFKFTWPAAAGIAAKRSSLQMQAVELALAKK